MSNNKKEQWRKILYKDQGYDDNYYEPSEFLKGLQTNVNVVHYTFYEAVIGASYLSNQINVSVLYLVLFELIQLKYIRFQILLSTTIIISILCLFCYIITKERIFKKDVIIDLLENFVILVCLGYGFTPIFRTLTTTISTDTIYIMTFLLFIIALVFHDYGMDAPIVNSAFSLNLALAGSICLISRLQTDRTAFCFLTLALCCFCFWPNLRNKLTENHSRLIPWMMTITLTPLSVIGISLISVPLAVLHLLKQIFILLICPAILVKMQHYKSTIHGPWDEATLNLKKYE